MTETLFTDYKNNVVGIAQSVYGLRVSDGDMPDLMRVLRLAHRQYIPVDDAASISVALFGPRLVISSETRVTLTEAAETALAQRDALRATDGALGLPVSSPVAAPLPILDPCSDDEPFVKSGKLGPAKPIEGEWVDDLVTNKADQEAIKSNKSGAQVARKVPRK